MFKKVTYNQPLGTTAFKYDAERECIRDFIHSEDYNMCFEYNTERDAVLALMSVCNYAKREALPVSTKRQKNKLFIIHKENSNG